MKSQKENRNIKIPEQLRQQKLFALKISENNEKLFKHVQCLRTLVQKIHQTYGKMSKSILKISEGFQKKMLNYKDGTSMCIINFIRGINTIHLNISNQINNNTVALNTKTYKITKTRKQIIHQKLIKINQLVTIFLQEVDLFNQKDERYVKKSMYFQDYEEDVIKYYSITDNKNMYNKLLEKQKFLQQKLQKTYTIKVQLKSGLIQMRVSLKQFFQMIKTNVQQYKKLLTIIRKKINITKFFNESVIQEVSSQAQQSVRNQKNNNQNHKQSQREQQKSIIQDRKLIINSFQAELQAQQILYDFIQYLKAQIQSAGLSIDKIREQKQYIQIDDRKLQMSDVLNQELIVNIKSIKDQIAKFRQIILRLSNYFEDVKILQQLKKYRKHKFQIFLSDTEPLCDLYKKKPKSTAVQEQYKALKNRFQQIHRLHMAKFRQIVIKLFQKISQEYKTKSTSQVSNYKNSTDIFSKNSLFILMIPFFSNKQETPPKFQSCYQVKKYSRLMITNHNQKLSLDIASDVSMQMSKKKQKQNMGCCGLLCFGNQKKQSKVLQKFNCALKNGILLLQGKLKLHQSYIGFVSIFNPKNIFFNNCDIRIPKWDILEIKKETYLLSILIIICTTHGNIQFTSFLNDPLAKMEQLYSNRSPCVALIQNKRLQTIPSRQVQQLQQKFQSQLPILINKQQFRIESLSTYLSQDKKNLSISVQYHKINQVEKYFFEIKIIQLGGSIKYQFVHQNSMKDIKIKSHLEKIAMDIINQKTKNVFKIPTIKNINKNHDKFQNRSNNQQIDSINSCSFIQKKQNNQFSFSEQPNFLYRMQENNQIHEGDPSFNYMPDLEIFKKQDDKTKRIINSRISSQNKFQQNLQQKSKSFYQKNKTIKMNQKTLQKIEINNKDKLKVLDSINTESVFSTKSRQKRIQKSKKYNTQRSIQTKTEQPKNINFVLYLIGAAIIINMILSIFK